MVSGWRTTTPCNTLPWLSTIWMVWTPNRLLEPTWCPLICWICRVSGATGVPPPTSVASEKSRAPRGISTSNRPSLPLTTSGVVVVTAGVVVTVGVTVGVGVTPGVVVAVGVVPTGFAVGVTAGVVTAGAGIAVPLARNELSRLTVMGCIVAGSALGLCTTAVFAAAAFATASVAALGCG